ncbi:acyl carrier protein [Eggerthella sp. YY7918]|uniref:acyl carrier protein n=1 Tax=Eggerthella sp. (strain YY7918) TaxID=502558 RepID=UPI000217176B|nr:phosphopantetheine-binding protein [Eggerthella sp. YY7918]BAK43971.1 acyl carrier protein [Eggerthella sp. YY7918]
MNEFQEEVVGILKDKAVEIFNADPATLSGDTRFVEDLHCKSVNIVQFASALEDEYEVEVPFMELNKMKTFGEAAKLIDDKLSM